MDVRWSPNHDDRFYTFGTNLSLFKVSEITDENTAWMDGGQLLSDYTYSNLLLLNTDVSYRCIAWHPGHSPDHLIAAGQSSGRVLLTTFGKGGHADTRGLLGKEFVTRHQRPCLYLEWNPTETHLLAEVLERYRQDFSILIWDIRSIPSYDMSGSTERKLSTVGMEGPCVSRPAYELCAGEIVTSMAWFPRDGKCLVTAIGNRALKVFDARETPRPSLSVTTKSVYGLTFDKQQIHQLASFHENQISIWDSRHFDKPVVSMQENRHITKLSWNPTRAGLLASLGRDSDVVKLYDIQYAKVEGEQQQKAVDDSIEVPCITERVIRPRLRGNTSSSTLSSASVISSIDWHPKISNRLLVVSHSGLLADVFLSERKAICWSPDIYLTWADRQELRQFHSIKMCKESSDDIGSKMRRRALKGYGVTDDLSEVLSKQIHGDKQLRQLWKFIFLIKKLEEDPEFSFPTGFRPSSGVNSLVKSLNARSDIIDFWPWHFSNFGGATSRSHAKRIYRSDERKYAIILCGWTLDKDSLSLPLIDSLEESHEYERSAAIAVFSLKVSRAIEVLKTGANWRASHASAESVASADLNVIAMAIAGFNGETSNNSNQLWREQCRNLGCSLAHPYLRAVFAFLTVMDNETYEDVLMDTQLELEDRVAFACLYLPDVKLHEFVERQTVKCIQEGNLTGVFLSGMFTDGISLLQQYVDRTGDVQTAAVAFSHCVVSSEQTKDSRVASWIAAYCELLDIWRLWHQRAEFDIFRHHSSRSLRDSEPQVLVSCNFCSKPIASDSVSTVTRFTTKPFSVTTSPTPPALAKLKATCCIQCRKPLPRCALCLLNLSTSVGTVNAAKMKALAGTGQKISKVSEWMTWCQTCRHGGHASHIMDWFRDHTECPVSGCECHCMSLDSLSNAVSELNTSPPTGNRASLTYTS